LEPWQDFVQKLLLEDKFDGWMQDFGDTRYAFDRDNLRWFAVKHNKSYPLSAEEYANTYPLVYHKLTYEIADGINPDFMHFCRSSSAGSASYQKLLWGGDQSATWNKIHGYPSLITAGISAGLSGYGYWAPDVLCNSPSRELWMRWVQFATFTTVLRDHLWENKKSSIDLWTDMETRVYFKKYAEIHMQLVPYLRKMAEQYKAHGTPIIRHMMLEFPDDRNTLECEYQYMFGDSYLVAPVVEEGATTISVYFPKGEWKSFWSNDTLTSYGEWINVDAPIDQIPVFEMLR
jgi:sulfoquinovosidase